MSGTFSSDARANGFANRLFDASFYLNNNTDVAAALPRFFSSASQHFTQFGKFEIERTSLALFNAQAYIAANLDVANFLGSRPGFSAFDHFIQFGVVENRGTGTFAGNFNGAAYLAANADVAAAVGPNGFFRSAFEHFILFGASEGRVGTSTTGQQVSITPTPPVIQGITLTINADAPGASSPAANTQGTSANDTFNGVVGAGATLSAADIIAGNAGVDTLSVAATSGATSVTGNALITSVEVVNVRGAGVRTIDNLTLDGTGLPLQAIGLTGSFNANGGVGATFTASNIAALVPVAPIALNLTGVTGLGAVGINGTGATTVTINSTGSANATGAFTAANASILNIAATTNLTLDGVTMLTGGIAGVVNVSGAAASVDLGVLGATVGTVTASGLTAGGITASLGSATQTVTGGAGQDIISTNGIVLGTGSVNAGASLTDRLVVTVTADLTAVTGAKYTSFEQLQANNGVLANASFVTGITDIRINDLGAATGVIGLSAAQASKIAIIAANSAAGAITIGLADSLGTADAVTAAVTNSTAAGGAQTADLTAISLAGVESLTLTTNGTTAANSGVLTLTTPSAVALTSLTYTNAGNTQLTIDATHTGSSLVINGSSSTGTSTINASAYLGGTAAQAITINSGSGIDAIFGSVGRINTISSGAGNDIVFGGILNDVISLGDGDDRVNGGPGADAMTGNAGNDTFVFTTTVLTQGVGFAAGNSSYANVDRITDFVGNGAAAGDSIELRIGASFGAQVFTATTVAVVTAVTVATAADFTALAAAAQAIAPGGLASTAAVAQVYDVTVLSGNLAGRVLIINDDTAAIFASDTFIGLTGITGALNAQDFMFV